MKTIHREPRLELSVREKCRTAAVMRATKQQAIERWENEGGEVSGAVPLVVLPSVGERAGAGNAPGDGGERRGGVPVPGNTP